MMPHLIHHLHHSWQMFSHLQKKKTEKIEWKVKQNHEEHNLSVQKSAKSLETFFRKRLENTTEDITEKINNVQDIM